MTGDWINAVARRMVTPATHRCVVLPALADLQYETRTRASIRLIQSYAGAWNAVFAGVLHDLGLAVQRPGVVDDMRTAAGLIVMQLAYYGCMLSLAMTNISHISPADLARMAILAVALATAPVIALVLSGRRSLDADAEPEHDEIG